MNELAKITSSSANGNPDTKKTTPNKSVGEDGIGPEGERERTIAKAALSIAELSWWSSWVHLIRGGRGH